MGVEENKALLQRVIDECFNQGNLAAADELVSPDAQEMSPGLPPGIPRTGSATLKAIVSMLRTAFPDLRVTADEMIAEGDGVMVRATWTGTHQGAFMDIPPTSKRVTWSTLEIVHVRDRTIVSHFGLQDMMGLMQQIGAMPAMGAGRA